MSKKEGGGSRRVRGEEGKHVRSGVIRERVYRKGGRF